MASEYLKWKYRDVKPDEPPPPLKGWPKVKNWLHYNAVYLAVGAGVLVLAAGILWSALGIGRVEPDYTFAYVGKTALPEDTKEALKESLATLGEDVNGDGEVTVELRSYVSGGGDSPDAAGFGTAAAVTLMADITSGESVFFITDDPLTLQAGYQVLAGPDGELPAEDDYSWEGKAIPWSDCPSLTALPLGEYNENILGSPFTGDSQELMSGLYIGRRGFANPKQNKNRDANEKMWSALTEGSTADAPME